MRYSEYNMHLSPLQKKKLGNAIAKHQKTVLKWEARQLKKGNYPLLLTTQQRNKIERAKNAKKGVQIVFSLSQLRQMKMKGGFLSSLLPVAKEIGKNVLLPVISAALQPIGSAVGNVLGDKVSRKFGKKRRTTTSSAPSAPVSVPAPVAPPPPQLPTRRKSIFDEIEGTGLTPMGVPSKKNNRKPKKSNEATILKSLEL